MVVAKKHSDQLDRLKNNVSKSYEYFFDNYKRFREFRRFIFESNLTDADRAVLDTLNKPHLEFNILESYISRLLGDFDKFEPSIEVQSSETMIDNMRIDLVKAKTTELVEGYLRNAMYEFLQSGDGVEIYKDLLSSGFSVIKIYTEYQNSKSFDQVIRCKRVFEPTLCGFDPMARNRDKGDGAFCFELIPKTKEDFEASYPDVNLKDVKFTKSLKQFHWSYKNNKDEILLVGDYYEKKKQKTKIYQLSNGQVKTADEYEEKLNNWDISEQPPTILAERFTNIEYVHRYIVIENQIIRHQKTSYSYLPLIFADGNSVLLQKTDSTNTEQMTRPYVYQAIGIQRLKNYSGQTLAHEIEMLPQSKIIAAKESIPEEAKDAYIKPQEASVYTYNAFKDNNPDVPLPPPQMLPRPSIPQEIAMAFDMADKTTQMILGSFDAALGINDNQLSGKAIVEAATQSNAAAMPCLIGYLHALQRIATIYVDLIPKYIVTPRTLPVIAKDGSRSYTKVNGDGMQLDYEPNALQVYIKAGLSFNMQKNRSLQVILSLMQASPLFAQIAQQKPEILKILLDNIEIRGVDSLKTIIDEYIQEQQQAQQTQQQQPNPIEQKMQLDQMKLMADQKRDADKNQIEAGKLAIAKQEADTDLLLAMGTLKGDAQNHLVDQQKISAENARTAADMTLKHVDQIHRHSKELRKESRDMLREATSTAQTMPESEDIDTE